MNIRPAIVFFLFFVSGFTALVLEVVWTKQTLLLFGNTTMSAGTVIAAFMSGLAAGSFFFGKIADRKPAFALLLYGILEGGVAFFALLFPYLLEILHPVYQSIYHSFSERFFLISTARFILCFVLLMIPTTLMGGTFPLLSRYFSRDPGTLKANISKLYAVNLFGAMSGSFASGFLLIHALGLRASSLTAAGLNFGIFFYLAWRSRRSRLETAEELKPDTAAEGPAVSLGRLAIPLVVVLLSVHGFTAFMVQICWTRTLALILGSSTYAFSAMLTTFLAGLGLGSFVVSRLVRKGVKFSLAGVGLLEMAAGASILIFIPLFEWLIYYFIKFYPWIRVSENSVFIAQFAFSFAAMIVPTFLMGMVFPAAISYLGKPKDIGKTVGFTYAADTLGGVLGSFLTAFVLIAHIGLNGSLRLAGLLALAGGLLVAAAGSDRGRLKVNLGKAAAAALSALFLFYPWDKNLFSAGVFMYSDRYRNVARMGKERFQKWLSKQKDLLYYKDGYSSTVTVTQTPPGGGGALKARSLHINGKVEASTTGDMETQLSVSYIPLFAHPDPRQVLVIGLGSGVTLSAVAEFGSVREIECVEIEPAVVEASRFFTAENKEVLKDPRVRLIIGDGRNHLEFSPRRYDVIISEPSNPWISGVSSLFTEENYRAALAKLKPGGIYGQWLHAYQMSLEDFILIIRTFASAFPETNLFKISAGDYLLLGSPEKIRFDDTRAQTLLREFPTVHQRLRTHSRFQENFLIGTYLFSGDNLKNMLAGHDRSVNTDDHMRLEYSAPKHLYENTSYAILRSLYWNRFGDLYPEFYNLAQGEMQAKPDLWRAFFINGREAQKSGIYDVSLLYFEEALKLKPGEPAVLYAAARTYEKMGKFADAEEMLQKTIDSAGPSKRAALSLLRLRLKREIEDQPEKARDASLLNRLAAVSFAAGERGESVRALLRAIAADPNFAPSYANLARYYFMSGKYDRGQQMLIKARAFEWGEEDAILQKAIKAGLDAEQKIKNRRLSLERRVLDMVD